MSAGIDPTRFWAKVDKSAGPDACWPWRGATWTKGYGQVVTGSWRKGERKQHRAHRVAYELTYGPVDARLHMCHRCDNPICVNPAHIFPGTHQDNMRDRHAKGRSSAPRGEQSPTASLTNIQASEMRRLFHAYHYTRQDLATRFGVSKAVVTNVIAGRSYRFDPLDLLADDA